MRSVNAIQSSPKRRSNFKISLGVGFVGYNLFVRTEKPFIWTLGQKDSRNHLQAKMTRAYLTKKELQKNRVGNFLFLFTNDLLFGDYFSTSLNDWFEMDKWRET